ncbi:MAG TPA: J domain-containing protein [Acidimicrobiales bacterium]|nr:J domain-containing protein [Acidimicrobiales bacterium]
MAGRSFYDELGVAADASDETLRTVYRRRARQLHPDVAPDPESGDAMRRLNEAWAVLGDPQRRRRYDENLAAAARLASVASPPVAPPSAPSPPPEPSVGAEPPRRIWFLRPSFLILAVLAVLFVVTAYAGPGPGQSGGSPGSTPTSIVDPSAVHPVGLCLATVGGSGLNTLVPCTVPNSGQILAEVTDPHQCPTGTVGHLWTLRPTVLCTTSPPSP